MKSWTVSFFRQWQPYMSALSVLRYRKALQRVPGNPVRDKLDRAGSKRTLSLRMKQPFERVVLLRENTFDFITFEEVVVEQVYKIIPEHLPRCERIIDLGANIGLTSLYLAACYPSCKIVSVEPLPENYEMLRKNVARLIETERCLPMLAAVWGSDKSLAFVEPEISDRYNAYAVREAAEPNVTTDVEGLTMQTIMQRAGFREVDIVKIDIEGAEAELFKGDLGWLKHTGAIAIEFHGDTREACAFDDIMREHRFTILAESKHTVLAASEQKKGSAFPR